MIRTNYNPDVLSCLANLSNDEVFTPPNLANQVLDLLPKELWSNTDAKFLDPVSKSGVFLREIAKRLMVGLEKQMPNLQERINHIYTNQIYGIAITELTSLLSRRSVYCSKAANGKYSVCESFEDEQGNIIYGRIEHSWLHGNCKFCGASEKTYDRGGELETHAYQFIHTDKPEKIFNNMKFDVIVGNPPYQLKTSGPLIQATALYNHFVNQARKLNPRFLIMIIPARWFSGGMGLDKFREEMLGDSRLRKIIDFPVSTDCFAGVQIKGGVCYFLWDRDHPGLCEVTTMQGGQEISKAERPLLEEGSDIFIRYNSAVSILQKVKKLNESSLINTVSSQKPFGLSTTFRGKARPFKDSVRVYETKGVGYIARHEVPKNKEWIDRYKVIIPRLGSGSDNFPHTILGKPFVGEPSTCCSETYIVIGPYKTKAEVENVISYISTRFFRFLVLLQKSTQDALKRVYTFVPIQDFSKPWKDEDLYKKYDITSDEIEFIESMIRPMELAHE